MIDRTAAARPGGLRGGDLALPIAVTGLVALGYAGMADLRVAAACLGALLLALWGLAAYHRPHVAIALSCSMLLVAGTKFRTRDADASLAGALDAQIVLELALFAFIGVAVVSLWLRTSRDRRGLSGTEIAVLGYAALAALSVLWSAAPMLTAVRAVQLVIVGLFSIVTLRTVAPADVLGMTSRAVTAHVLVFALIAAAAPWAYHAFSSADTGDDAFRFRWFAVHPIDAATLAGLGAIGLIGTLFRRPGQAAPTRIPAVLGASALVVVLVLTKSRGPMLALAAAAGVLWLLHLRPTLRAAALLFAATGAGVAVVFAADFRILIEWVATRDTAITRAFFRGQSADTVFELNGRLGLWADLRPLLLDRLAIGHGYQASRAVLLDVAEWAAFAHNAFLQTVLDLGVVGMAIVLCLFAPVTRSAFRRSRDPATRATVVALVVFLTLNAMATESFAAVPHFETLLLFLCALCASAMLISAPAPAHAVERLHAVTP